MIIQMGIKFTQKLELGSCEDGVRCKHVCIFVRVHVCVGGVYVCSCVCMCVCARSRTSVCVYIHTLTRENRCGGP